MFRLTTLRMAAGFALLACLMQPSVAASTQSSSTKAGKKPPTSVRFIDAPSSESPAARKKRLQKECKGRPNAGACLGMTGRG